MKDNVLHLIEEKALARKNKDCLKGWLLRALHSSMWARKKSKRWALHSWMWARKQSKRSKRLQSDVPDFHGDYHFISFRDWIYSSEN